MADLLALSSRYIDTGRADGPVNRVTNELSEIVPGVAMVESFSHSVIIDAGDQLLVVDASGAATGRAVVEAARTWSTMPIGALVYTHGHVDHVGGSGAVAADAQRRGNPSPTVIAHEHVLRRLDRYRRTDHFNQIINNRQFGGVPADLHLGIGGERRFLPDDVMEPEVTYRDEHRFALGGLTVELHHGRGETDDHTWAWLESHRAICSGDFLIWHFPNAGNPQKVQRYPDEWAAALRAMTAKQPELLLPAHGLPIVGRERIAAVLDEVATTLETLVVDVLALMNAGADLDTVIHTVRVAEPSLAKPFMRPFYDEPEFVVRNIWRLYGGWWDGDPAHLKPPPADQLARELAALAGGAGALMDRAERAARDNDLRLGCQLAQFAFRAAPTDSAITDRYVALFNQRRDSEWSLMSRGIFNGAAKAANTHRD